MAMTDQLRYVKRDNDENPKGKNAMSIQGQARKFSATVLQCLPEVPEDIMQNWIENPKALQKVLKEVLLPPIKTTVAKLSWFEATQQIYESVGMTARFLETAKDFKPDEDLSCWECLMVKELTYAKMVEAYQRVGVTLYTFDTDLQKAIKHEEEQRDPNRSGSYVVSFKANVEADEENKNQSANQRKVQKDITLQERLLLGLVYFLTTGEHLDTDNWTLCAGSRRCDGGVPAVGWRSGRRGVCVYWGRPVYRDDCLRARSVVSIS